MTFAMRAGGLLPQTVAAWKYECVIVRMKYLCDELAESYVAAVDEALPGVNNLEQFEIIHKRERENIFSVFNSTIKTYVPQSILFKKQLQAGIRSKRAERLAMVTSSLVTRAQEVYEKHYHMLDNVKQLSRSQQITLVDAGSPYSNLVAFKGVLGNYLNTCRLELISLGPANDKLLTEVATLFSFFISS